MTHIARPRPRHNVRPIHMTYVSGQPVRIEIDLDDPDLLPAERQILTNIAARTHRQFQRAPLDAYGRRHDELAPDYAPYV